MAVLAIFSVKRLTYDGATHWTYGGFGSYLGSVIPYFERVVLVARVARARPAGGYYPLVDPRLDVVPLPATRNELDALRSIPSIVRAARQVVPRVDVVNARMPDYTGVVAAMVARQLAAPCFIHVIDDWAQQAQRVSAFRKAGLGTLLKAHLRLYDRFERAACRGQLVFAQGESSYAKHVGRADAHLVVSAAHHHADVVAGRERFVRRPFKILSIGRLNGVKNQSLILRALRRLLVDGEQWSLTLVGDGPQRAPLEREARLLGIADRIAFHGLVRHGPALWRYFDEADVFTLASRSEGTPKVLLEAMARGLPVVASRVGGVATIVEDGRTGLLFDDDDEAALVGCLRRYAADPCVRRQVVTEGSKLARQHTVEAEAGRMMAAVFERWPHLEMPFASLAVSVGSP